MALLRHLFILCTVFTLSSCRPPRQPKPADPHVETPHVKSAADAGTGGNGTAEWDLGIEYNRYLQEVVQVLESDPEFRKKLEDSDVEKIRDGSIAEELKFVDHGLRSKLDDVKRKEVDRLRKLAVKQYENNRGIDRNNLKMPVHIDVKNHRFDVEDLKKLIKSTTNDLEKADVDRRQDFKKYEMEKKFEGEERLRHIADEDARETERKRVEGLEKKHKDHEKLNHPMTKDQLEEVWEDQDHMRPEDWDPKTFFAMHDLNGDGFWEEDELKVLFQKELDKAYDPNAPEDDMKERMEESERMREHVLKESDRNKDRLISLEEFLTQTKEDEFNKHEDWEGLDEEEPEYSDDEFKQFEAQRNAEIQAMIAQGVVPPGYPYYGDVPPGAIPHPGAVPPPNLPQFQVPHPGGQGQQQPQFQVPHPGGQGQPQFQQAPHPGVQGQQQPSFQQAPHPGVQGRQVYRPNPQQGQPIQGAMHPNAFNPNQPALNPREGAHIQAEQPVRPNIPLGDVSQNNIPNNNQNFASNSQVPQAQIQMAGAPSGSQFQQVNQGQQIAPNMQPQHPNQPPQVNQQQIMQNAPLDSQKQPKVQYIRGGPQKAEGLP